MVEDELVPEEAGWVRPPDEAVAGAARALVQLVEKHLPQRFYGGEHLWRAYSAAMVMRMLDTLEAMMVLMVADFPVDGLVLLRTLYEQVVVFCWVSIDRDAHLQRWISGAYWWERKLHNDALDYDVKVLTPAQLKATEGAHAMPQVPQLAKEVDEHWGGRLIGFRPAGAGREGILNFRGLYIAIYRMGSRPVHAQPHALDPYADFLAYPRRVSSREPTPESIWWPLAIPLVAQALLVCHEELGWPDPDAIRAINNRMYGL